MGSRSGDSSPGRKRRITIRCTRSRGPRGFFCLQDFRRGPVNVAVIHLRGLMSAWHYHTRLLPLEGVVRFHGAVPSMIEVPRATPENVSRLDENADRQPNYWSHAPDAFVRSLTEQLACWLPETDSWSETARMFGDDLNDQCSIWLNDDRKLERITIEFSLSNPIPQNLRRLLAIPEISNCVMHGIQSERIYQPFIENWTSGMLE